MVRIKPAHCKMDSGFLCWGAGAGEQALTLRVPVDYVLAVQSSCGRQKMISQPKGGRTFETRPGNNLLQILEALFA